MEFALKGALKKYRRMRAWRHAGMLLLAFAAMAGPWLFDLGRTDTLICWLGAVIVVMTGQLEMRLKTMQVRLAGMEDHLIGLRGGDELQGPHENSIGELNDW